MWSWALAIIFIHSASLPDYYLPVNVTGQAVQSADSTNLAQIHKVAVFDTDDRKAINDLREGLQSDLATEERSALLRAASKTGRIGCKAGFTNGTLIQLSDGRDAVISSAHSFLDPKSGKFICEDHEINYLPNLTFYNPKTGKMNNFEKFKVPIVDFYPMNYEHVKGSTADHLGDLMDFLIFPLSRNISDDRLPDGTVRGYMKFDVDTPTSFDGYFIGYMDQFRGGLSSAYQICNIQLAHRTLYHLCDTQYSSSSSALTRMVDGELVLAGIHVSEWGGWDNSDVHATPVSISQRNIGVGIYLVRDYLSEYVASP